MTTGHSTIQKKAIERALRSSPHFLLPSNRDIVRAEDELRILAAVERAAEDGRIGRDVVGDPAYLSSIMYGIDQISSNTSDAADASVVSLEFWSEHHTNSARALRAAFIGLGLAIVAIVVAVISLIAN